MSASLPWPATINPMLLNWGGPDEIAADRCSLCDAPFGDDDIPLRLWRSDGWCVAFCGDCQKRHWGFSGA